jgi:hypothetical protein
MSVAVMAVMVMPVKYARHPIPMLMVIMTVTEGCDTAGFFRTRRRDST